MPRMKIGQGHNWKYGTGNWSEVKIAPKKWAFKYKQTKYRKGKKAPPGTGMPVGDTITWSIKAKQRARKVSPNKYQLTMTGIKKQVGYKGRRKKRRYYGK